MVKEGIKFRVTKNRIIFLIILCSIISSVLFYYFFIRPIYYVNYNGQLLKFRVDLREANKIRVYTDESSVYNLLWNPEIKNLTIVFMNTSDMNYTEVEAFEIAFKLKIAYMSSNFPVKISGQDVSSFENLTKEDVFIALIPPSISNETSVRVEDNIIFIRGKSFKEFDLATVKFLMIALEIKL